MTTPPEPAVTLPADTLDRWAADCLRAVGLPEADAAGLAAALVQASLWGIDAHGVARLPDELGRLQRGAVQALPRMELQRTGPCTALLHGDRGQGHVVAARANRVAMDLAREAGIGAVGVTDSSPCGAPGLYAREAARAGLVGLAFTHGPGLPGPHAGRRQGLGANPIAVAFPRAGGAPVCLDLETASFAAGRTTAEAGDAVPPAAAPHPHAGHGLALMVDLLCGPLLGNAWGRHLAPADGDPDAAPRVGAFFLVLDPARFGGPLLPAVVAQMAAERAAEPGAVGLPGDAEQDRERERRVRGIPIDSGLLAEMRRWSARLGTAPPA